MKILLKNGLVYDGSRNKPQKLDILINNNVIEKLSENLNETADKVIDCTNLCISPGFIDAHSHNDFFVHLDEATFPFLKQGITTQIVGNCGFSAYGIDDNSPYKEHVGSGLFKISNPSSLSTFKKATENKLIVNIVPLIGHGTTRISVAGLSHQKLTKEELNKQLEIVERGMKEGAFGGSLGLMYEPGMYAPFEELVEFAKVIKKYDGILTVHPRANSKIALGYPLFGKPHIEQALDEVIHIMRETGVKVEYSHLIFVGKSSWKCVDRMLEVFKNTRKSGYEIGYDMYPFTYGASTISVILPSWYLKLSKEERRKPFNKFKLKLIINITKKLLGIDFDDLVISYIEGHPEYEGRTVAEIAKSENTNPFDMYIKLVEISEGKGRIMLGRYYNEDIIKKLMADDLSIYMTDAWYEENGTQNGGTFQAFPLFLEKTKEHKFNLEDTIHKMTGATADRFQIPNRGYIKEGYAADITIFNYDEISVNKADPSETPKGIKYVLINGQIVLANNEYLNIKNGQLITKTRS